MIALDDRLDYGEDRLVGLGLLDGRVVNVIYTEPDEQTRRIIPVRKVLQHEKSSTSDLSETSSESKSQTGWERFDAMTDDEIDTSDSPPLTEEFFAKARWLMPGERATRETVKVELELDPKILAWFQAQGQDYEQRMRAALRLYAEAHRATA